MIRNKDIIIITFISHHVMDGYNIDKKQWTVKTLVREAVIATPPRRPRKRYPTAHLLYRSGLQIQKDIYIRLNTVN